MKTTDLAIILGAALVLLYVVRKNVATAATPNSYGAKLIDVDNTNGWRYYTDGTAISPDGVYYLQGKEVYNPQGMLSL